MTASYLKPAGRVIRQRPTRAGGSAFCPGAGTGSPAADATPARRTDTASTDALRFIGIAPPGATAGRHGRKTKDHAPGIGPRPRPFLDDRRAILEGSSRGDRADRTR